MAGVTPEGFACVEAEAQKISTKNSFPVRNRRGMLWRPLVAFAEKFILDLWGRSQWGSGDTLLLPLSPISVWCVGAVVMAWKILQSRDVMEEGERVQITSSPWMSGRGLYYYAWPSTAFPWVYLLNWKISQISIITNRYYKCVLPYDNDNAE